MRESRTVLPGGRRAPRKAGFPLEVPSIFHWPTKQESEALIANCPGGVLRQRSVESRASQQSSGAIPFCGIRRPVRATFPDYPCTKEGNDGTTGLGASHAGRGGGRGAGGRGD